MKITVLSDIHSNVFALDAVLKDAKQYSSDLIINLGDSLYGPIAPRETYSLLMEQDLITIRGNQDRQIYEATSDEIKSNPTMQFIHNEIGKDVINWLKTIPFDKQLDDNIYLCHGTPTNDLVYLLENIETGYAHLRSDKQIMELLNGQMSELILCGHTHIPRTVKLKSDQLVVNSGSVGLPAYTDDEPVLHSMENFSPLASYSIVEKKTTGWMVNHKKVSYNYELAIKDAKKRNREDWVHFLSTGRGL